MLSPEPFVRSERRDQKTLLGRAGGATGRSEAGNQCRRTLENHLNAGGTGTFT